MNVRRRTALALWRVIPILIVFLLLLPAALPKHVTSVTELLPPLSLMAIYFWSLERFQRVGYVTTFLAGLAQDALLALPFGSSAFIWLVFRYLARAARADIADQGFAVEWVYFAALLFMAVSLQWGIISAHAARAYPFPPLLKQWVLGVLLYPALHDVLRRLERKFRRKYWYLLKPA